MKSQRLPRQLSDEEKKDFIGMARTYTNNCNQHRKQREVLLASLRLLPSASDSLEDAATRFLSTVPRYYLHPVGETRKDSYPPLFHWVSEHPSHSAKFKAWINTPGLWHPDKRDQSRYYPHHHLDPSSLQLNIKANESAIVYDGKTGELVMVVLADVIRNSTILQWMSEVIGTGCKALRSIRLSDPGRMALVGYSAGSRSATCVGWTATLASGEDGREFKPSATGRSSEALRKFNIDISNVFACVWNVLKKSMPPEVIKDYEETQRIYKLPTMDADGKQAK